MIGEDNLSRTFPRAIEKGLILLGLFPDKTKAQAIMDSHFGILVSRR
jgi:hypothetical protein